MSLSGLKSDSERLSHAQPTSLSAELDIAERDNPGQLSAVTLRRHLLSVAKEDAERQMTLRAEHNQMGDDN